MAVDTGSVGSLYTHVTPLVRHGEHLGRWPSQRVFLALHTMQDSATLRRLDGLVCSDTIPTNVVEKCSSQLQLNVTRATIEALEAAGVCRSIDCEPRVWFRVC